PPAMASACRGTRMPGAAAPSGGGGAWDCPDASDCPGEGVAIGSPAVDRRPDYLHPRERQPDTAASLPRASGSPLSAAPTWAAWTSLPVSTAPAAISTTW